jgi:ArsR family transcriptional regulator
MKRQQLGREQLESVAGLFGVLAEATRLEILQALQQGPISVGGLVETLHAKQANISKQLGILYDAGLLSRERAGTQIYYSIREPMIFELCSLVCRKIRQDAQEQAKRFAGVGK